jgi:hypothetical protein
MTVRRACLRVMHLSYRKTNVDDGRSPEQEATVSSSGNRCHRPLDISNGVAD